MSGLLNKFEKDLIMTQWITDTHFRLILTMIAIILACISILTMNSSNRKVAIRCAQSAIILAIVNLILALVWH